MNCKKKKLIKVTFFLSFLLFFVSGLSLFLGSVKIPFDQFVSVLFNSGNQLDRNIILSVRLPRLILAIAIGSSLSLSGLLLQGLFRNPLVEPYTMGISGGAGLAVCLSIIFKLSFFSYFVLPISGALGSLSVILIIYLLADKKSVIRIQGILLIGVMISFISSSLVMLLMAISKTENLHGIILWTMGSLQEANASLIYAMLAMSLLALFLSLGLSKQLNALSLGFSQAHSLGINVEAVKRRIFLLASLLTGFCVSVAGIIGFVGLVVPHLMRLIVGRDHRMLIIASFFSGAIFLILCDTIARSIAPPLELPVGVITGLIGGTVFIYVLVKNK